MSSGAGLSDIMSAASLVLAVLAALFTFWLPDIAGALSITPDSDADNRAPQRRQVMRVLWSKSLPMAAAAIAAAAILAPRGWAIVSEAGAHRHEWGYDDTKALFALTFVLMLLLASVAAAQLLGLVAKRVALR
jgi:hypothetical protein